MGKIITAKEALDIEKAILFTVMSLMPADLDEDTLCTMTRAIFLRWCEAEDVVAIDNRFGIIEVED